jgi:glycosyltransferase involved in cell wall biosynthesis
MLQIPDAVVAGTSYWSTYFRAHFSIKRLFDIPNPVLIKDRKVARKGGAAQITVLFLARLEEGKGIRELVQAIENLADQARGLRFVIAGDGPLMPEVRARLAHYCPTGYVTIRGYVNETDKPQLFREADVYVLPTYSEVLPVSMLEAMSYGVAVIATGVGGIPDAIEHGVTGCLIEPRNVPQITDQIMGLAGDRRKLVQLAESGFERCCRVYDLEAVVARHFDVFRELAH